VLLFISEREDRRWSLRSLAFPLGSIFLLALLSGFAFSQDPSDDPAPPPLKLLSKTERTQLNEKADLKDRASLALQLMEARLKAAEKFRVDENYSLMYDELGGFHALMDNTLDFLLHNGSSEGKRLSSLKKFEIGLREFVPRVEAIRREAPINFEPYVEKLLKYISDAREKAIQPFFGNTVIQEN
jgi:hypothetical protein